MTPVDRLRMAFITVLGSGYVPIASGTWGSLVAVLVALPVFHLWTAGGNGRLLSEAILLGGAIAAAVIGISWGRWAIGQLASDDPKPFVLDEFAGQWLALVALPVATDAGASAFALAVFSQFFLFRVMDVLKLPPAAQAEHLPEGWGIVTDDLIAGVYANVLGQVIWRYTPAASWLGVSLGL